MLRKISKGMLFGGIAILAVIVFFMGRYGIGQKYDPEIGDWDSVNEVCKPARAGIMFATCCFDADQNPIPCKGDSMQQAAYNNQLGIAYVAHGIGLKNDGNIDIVEGKITSNFEAINPSQQSCGYLVEQYGPVLEKPAAIPYDPSDCPDKPDYEWLMIEASHIKVHPHAAGAVKGNQKMSRTKGGSTQNYIWPWIRMVCRSERLLRQAQQQIVLKLNI